MKDSIWKNSLHIKFLYIIPIGIMVGIFSTASAYYKMIAVIGLLFFCAVLIFKYNFDSLVLINILLLCVVYIEPAPADILFIPLFIWGFLNKKLNIDRIFQIWGAVLFLGVFILINLMQLFYVSNIYTAVNYFAITLYLSLYALFIFLYTQETNIYTMFKVYIIGSVVSAIIGLMGLMGFIGFYSHIVMYDSYRTKAFFKDPNVLGPYLVPAIIMLIWDIDKRKILKVKPIIHVFLIALVGLGIIGTFSRGAWVNLILAIFVYMVINFKRINYRRLLIYGAVLGLLLAAIWIYIAGQEFREFFEMRVGLQGYDVERFTTQRTGARLIFDNAFGYGPGQFEYMVNRVMGNGISAHNLYIRLAVENGIIGFLFMMALLVYILIALIFYHLKNPSSIASILIPIILGMLINSLVIDTLHWRHLWLFIGLGLYFAWEGYYANTCS